MRQMYDSTRPQLLQMRLIGYYLPLYDVTPFQLIIDHLHVTMRLVSLWPCLHSFTNINMYYLFVLKNSSYYSLNKTYVHIYYDRLKKELYYIHNDYFFLSFMFS